MDPVVLQAMAEELAKISMAKFAPGPALFGRAALGSGGGKVLTRGAKIVEDVGKSIPRPPAMVMAPPPASQGVFKVAPFKPQNPVVPSNRIPAGAEPGGLFSKVPVPMQR